MTTILTNDGLSAFHFACKNGHDKVVDMLIKDLSTVIYKEAQRFIASGIILPAFISPGFISTGLVSACEMGHDKVVR
jgi:hypothetical protein